jgi:signal transduction histidine kinase
LAATSQRAQLAFAPVEYVGILAAPLLWFIFALRFTGRDAWLTRGVLAAMGGVPVVLYAFVLTDPWHHLVYQQISTVQAGSWRVLHLVYGPAGWANVVYAYVLLAAGAIVILGAFWASPRIYRRQVVALMASAMAPWIVNALYQTGLGPTVDLTPLGFTLTGLGTAWAIRRAQLLDLAPVARGLIVESLNDGVAVLDWQDRLIDANAAFHTLADVPNIGAPASAVFAHWPELAAAVAGRGGTPREVASPIDPDRHFEPSITPLADRRGRQIGRVITLRDVSDRHRVMQELERARDAAEDLARAKSEFLATVSHEIRTPMNGVIGMTALLLDTRLDAQQRNFVETIRSSGGQLLSIINDILDFSKFDAGQMTVEHLPYDPRAAVSSVIALLEPQARGKGLRLEFTATPAVPPLCLGDEMRVRQIVTNLIGNAIKFTAAGAVSVSLDADLVRANADTWRLRLDVRDTGIGIPADRLDRLFRPFSQVDASVARRYGGTGLGLAISRRLAELMGGSVTVDSEAGHGSTFHVEWVVQRATAAAPTAAPAVPDAAAAAPLSALKILIAEDNPVNQSVVIHMLRRLGHTADLADDGAAAVAAVAQRWYDVVLMDVQMPNVDGLTATRRIREAGGPQPRIIAMTANAMSGDREACLASGMDDYISKPIDLPALQAALERNR